MKNIKENTDNMPCKKLNLKPVPVGERVKTFADLVSDAEVDYAIDLVFGLRRAAVRLPHGVAVKSSIGHL